VLGGTSYWSSREGLHKQRNSCGATRGLESLQDRLRLYEGGLKGGLKGVCGRMEVVFGWLRNWAMGLKDESLVEGPCSMSDMPGAIANGG
jgi:hypothetical protein